MHLTHPALVAQASDDLGDAVLLICLVLLGIFALPFVMAWLEPRQQGSHKATTVRAGGQRIQAPKMRGADSAAHVMHRATRD